MKSKMLLTLTGALAALAVACGSSDTVPAPASAPTTAGATVSAPAPTATSYSGPASTATQKDAPAEAPAPGAAGLHALSSGILALPAAAAFGEPGFHEVLTAAGNLPADLGETVGMNLVLVLSDAGRPGQTCSTQHPLSGCATVDWSDAPGRPNVPPDGIFVNSLMIELASGSRTFFLTDSGTLSDVKNRFDPG